MSVPDDWNEAGARWEEQRPEDLEVRLELAVMSERAAFGEIVDLVPSTVAAGHVLRVAVKHRRFGAEGWVDYAMWDVGTHDGERIIDALTTAWTVPELWMDLRRDFRMPSVGSGSMLTHWVWERLTRR